MLPTSVLECMVARAVMRNLWTRTERIAWTMAFVFAGLGAAGCSDSSDEDAADPNNDSGTVVENDSGTVVEIDGGVVQVDGGVVQVDGGILEIDGGVILSDGGVVEIDGGVVLVDGGVLEIDGGVVEVDAGFPPDTGPVTGPTVSISVDDYRDRMMAMWLAQSIANWTGLQTEGRYFFDPFPTDADWDDLGLEFVLFRDDSDEPTWPSDDDTDIEFIYLAGLFERNKLRLTPEEIQTDWFDHTQPGEFIWVSNLVAQTLMRRDPAAVPPSTSLLPANDQSLMIDAQLTTEMFGSFSPGMPAKALDIANLPILTTASGYSAHAAQFHVVMYSLAPVVDPSLALPAQILWLVQRAREYIPDTSKTAALIDFVVDDYLDNTDVNDWERTRDRVAEIFQFQDEQNDYLYLEWYESAVNLAGGLIAVLYGQGDFTKTVQIGTLSGWDSDNGTATMGGLLGILVGTQAIRDEFPGIPLSMEYNIGRTRSGFTNPGPFFSFEELANRMIDVAELAVAEAGGTVTNDVLTVPTFDESQIDHTVDNPLSVLHASSANNAMTGARQVDIGNATVYSGEGIPSATDMAVIADGLEMDYSGRDRQIEVRDQGEFDTSVDPTPLCAALTADFDPVTVSVTWTGAMSLAGVRFIEGTANGAGGSYTTLTVEARVGGEWQTMTLTNAFTPRFDRIYEIHELRFAGAVQADGLRISGEPQEFAPFVTICEIDGILAQ